VAKINIDAQLILKAGCRVVYRNFSSDFPHALHNEWEVNFNLANFYSEMLRRSSRMSYVGTLQESFGWNAARIETVSTKKIFLDKGNFCTKSNRCCSSYESSCTAANDDQVVLFLKDVRQ